MYTFCTAVTADVWHYVLYSPPAVIVYDVITSISAFILVLTYESYVVRNHTHAQLSSGPLSRTTPVNRHQNCRKH